MPIKIIQVFAHKKHDKRIADIFQGCENYSEKLNEDRILVRAFVPSEETEKIMDLLESYFSEEEDYRIIVVPVEASIPRPEEKEKEDSPSRVSREELYASVSRSAELSNVYFFLIIVSSLVAALGLLYSNFIAIIGAMVIAPLLGPNIALALATTLADPELAKKSIKTIVSGLFLALITSFFIGLFLGVDPSAPEIALRTEVGFADIVIALTSGSVGVIAFASGYFLTSLMGVMVAVALLPPLVVLGMLLGSGLWSLALPAAILLMVNLICINLSGIATFIALKVRPRTWWEADKAKRASRLALFLWLTLLLILIFLVLI